MSVVMSEEGSGVRGSLTSHEEEQPSYVLHEAAVPAAAQHADDPAEQDDGHRHAHEACRHPPQVCTRHRHGEGRGGYGSPLDAGTHTVAISATHTQLCQVHTHTVLPSAVPALGKGGRTWDRLCPSLAGKGQPQL